MRITKKMLQNKVDIITKELNLPETASRRVNDVYKAHVGHIRIDFHSIGDNQHYHLHQTVNERGAVANFLHEDSFSSQELYFALSGYIACLQHRK